jgi:hypothetical protein
MNGGLEPIDWWEGQAWEPHESWETTIARFEGLLLAIEWRCQVSITGGLCIYMSLLLALFCESQV